MERMDYPALGERVYRQRLDNGLQVLVIPRPEYRRQFAFFAARYGGMDLRFRGEDGGWVDTPAGIAHFLEHKMFDTEDGAALRTFAATGAADNAFTASHITGYYFEGTQGFEENLRALLELVSVPYFTPESVAKEQGIIAQEIRMCEDDPDNAVYYQLLGCLYANHPIRTPIVGTVESISALTPQLLYQCHAAFYRPENMVLCAAGDIDPERVAALAREVLPGSSAPAVKVDAGGPEPPGAVQPYGMGTMEVSMPLFEVGFKGDPAPAGEQLRQELVAQLASQALCGPSSALYDRLYRQGLINGSFECYYDAVPGCAYLSAGGESRAPEQVRQALLDEAGRIAREGIDPDLWERLKRAAYGGMVRRLNSLESTCIDLAESWLEGEDYLDFPRRFDSVDREDARRLLARWCTPERCALSVIAPPEGTAPENQ